MAKICFIGPPASGHLRPLMVLASALQSLGHHCQYLGPLDGQAMAQREGIEFLPLAVDELPLGTALQWMKELGKKSGWQAASHTVECFGKLSEALLGFGPQAIAKVQPDLIVSDAVERAGSSLAEHCQIPFVTACTILPSRPEATVPPFGTPWRPGGGLLRKLRNTVAHSLWQNFLHQNVRKINTFRSQWGLKPLSDAWSSWSTLAILCQSPASFDFPRQTLPKHFHYLGPWCRQHKEEESEFPWEQLRDKAPIFVSLGSVLGARQDLLHLIAEAGKGLGHPLVITRGGAEKEAELKLPGNPIVVDWAPQLALLEKACLTVTHGGLNTVLECLSNGVPLVVLPICNDQPGVGARVAWSGVGELLSLNELNVTTLRTTMKKVLRERSYREKAKTIADEIKASGGARAGAKLLERVITTGCAVNREV